MDSSLSLAAPFTRRDALRTLTLAFGAGAFGIPRAFAQDSAPPQIVSKPLTDLLSIVTGAGGNIALFRAGDASLVVDSGLADLATGTLAELTKTGPLALLVNTHWHFDHVGGNEKLARAGARIFASENCRKRVSTEQTLEAFNRKTPALPEAARPVVTFTHETALHVGSERVRLIPVPPAHTDSDVLVRFENANVLHMGDVFFHGSYPFIDYSSGGWIGGMAAAAKHALTLTDAGTKIIPGHGAVATQEDLKNYHAFLETVHERLAKFKAAGKTVQQVIAEAPFKDFDEKLGGGFLKPEPFTRITYEGLLRHGK